MEIIDELIGRTFISFKHDENELIFNDSNGNIIKFYHEQDCCESVEIDDIIGDLNDLLNSPLIKAEKRESEENPPNIDIPEYQGSFTWTFYHFATKKGYVDIRWYGESNGYYSEDVSMAINDKIIYHWG